MVLLTIPAFLLTILITWVVTVTTIAAADEEVVVLVEADEGDVREVVLDPDEGIKAGAQIPETRGCKMVDATLRKTP